MMRKITAMLAAFALAAATFVPTAAEARDRRGDGYWDGGRHGGYSDHRRRYRDRDGDAVAAGAVGLILGLAIGSLASGPREQRGCYDNYRRCAPPPPPRRCYDPCGGGYDEGYYDPRYDDRRGAYEREYGPYAEGSYDPYYDDRPQRAQCLRRERQWDRYARRYVVVDVPC